MIHLRYLTRLTIAFFVLAPCLVQADGAQFTASARVDPNGSCGGSPPQQIINSTSAVNLDFDAGALPDCTISVSASAGFGSVGLDGDLSARAGTGNIEMYAESKETMQVTNPVLAMIADEYDVFVTTSVNLDFFGSVFASLYNGGGFFRRGGGASVAAFAEISGFDFNGNAVQPVGLRVTASALVSNTDENGGTNAVGPFIDSDSFAGGLTTPEISVNPNMPVTITLRLDAYLGWGTYNDSNLQGIVNAGDTFSYALDGPVLNLPDGWTADTASGSVVNNQFVDVSAVPLPPMGIAFIAALAGIARARRN